MVRSQPLNKLHWSTAVVPLENFERFFVLAAVSTAESEYSWFWKMAFKEVRWQFKASFAHANMSWLLLNHSGPWGQLGPTANANISKAWACGTSGPFFVTFKPNQSYKMMVCGWMRGGLCLRQYSKDCDAVVLCRPMDSAQIINVDWWKIPPTTKGLQWLYLQVSQGLGLTWSPDHCRPYPPWSLQTLGYISGNLRLDPPLVENERLQEHHVRPHECGSLDWTPYKGFLSLSMLLLLVLLLLQLLLLLSWFTNVRISEVVQLNILWK